MSGYIEWVKCPSCGYGKAYFDFTAPHDEILSCIECGYEEGERPIADADGIVRRYEYFIDEPSHERHFLDERPMPPELWHDKRASDQVNQRLGGSR